ncbi:MAG TPA: PD-(D/E)XK nuclease family protein [Gammaproteobacteria bacterium]|nr:PD-(D/E)XK nuclease family protein [Gammaproteobacteria bacterium]
MTTAIDDITAFLGNGVTVITPIRRLSRYILQQYAVSRLSGGRLAWETPDCIPWNAWLMRTWEELAERDNINGTLLSPHQQHRLWQSIIQSSSWSGQILQLAGTAYQARLSYLRCHEWRIPVFPEGYFINDDAHAFRQWHENYLLQCKRHAWIDEAGIAEYLLKKAAGIPAQHVVLYGFDALTPLQEQLLARLETEAGFVVEKIEPVPGNASVSRHESDDVAGEIRTAACWACRKLNTGATHIGIVVHNLGNLHGRVRTIFEDVLCPGKLLADRNPETPFNISLGIPLAEYPLVNTALSILALGKNSLYFDDISDLFRTPYIRSSETELQQRALLEKHIRRYAEHRLDFPGLFRVIDQLPQSQRPVVFLDSLQTVSGMFQGPAGKQSADTWARTFSGMLSAFGWPGDRTLDSDEYQTCAEFHSALGQFSVIDRVGGDMGFNEALSTFRHLLRQSGFQPETPEVPIQIMGMTAAAGMQFDHLWITGLSEESWPPPTETDPFIPLQLQRDERIPGSSPETRLADASRLLDGLIASSPEVVLGYPKLENDRPLRPAPVVRKYPWLPTDEITVIEEYAAMIHAVSSLETIRDASGPPLEDTGRHRGGTGLFRDQAACPFRAFARHRLVAEGLEISDIGLDAPDRGTIVHHLLELFWNRVGSQEALQFLSGDQIDAVIREIAEACVDKYRKRFPLTMSGRFAALETERLQILMAELLEQEKQRQPFRVLACEQEQSFHFGDFDLTFRTDRVDELEDGRRVIIDYKTGSSKPSEAAWLSSRPDEPQLPLYAINSEGVIGAVVFAWVRRGNTGFRGLSVEPDMLPGVKTLAETKHFKEEVPHWDDLMAKWRATLSALAHDFKQGHALVDPKSADSCNYCDLHALCRIHELKADGHEPGC